jgi:hypothetical protein
VHGVNTSVSLRGCHRQLVVATSVLPLRLPAEGCWLLLVHKKRRLSGHMRGLPRDEEI